MKQDEDVFEFETEALALKNNEDYAKLIQCLNVLSGLREKSLEDLNEIFRVQDVALADPIEFTRKLKHGENLGIPERLSVPDLPDINWEKYKLHPFDDMRPITRPKVRDTKHTVRGRGKPIPKPATFNQIWTAEEQIRLEELLVINPPEECEANRFKKIAKALGNRTLSQVTSRCQKYFIKLHKAGLPVPGRIPRRVREGTSKKTPFKYKATPEMKFSDYSDLPESASTSVSSSFIKVEIDSDDSDATDFSQSLSDRKLGLLRRVRFDLMRQTDNTITHPGFMCNICKDDPLKGTRWHCAICPDMDVCSWCLIEQLETETLRHPLDHPLISYQLIPSSLGDKDYPQPVDNYLDTNYQPG